MKIGDHFEKSEDLKQQVQQFQQVIATLHEGYLLVDQQGQIYDVNAAYCELSGYSREKLLSMNLADLRSDISSDKLKALLSDLATGESRKFETKHRRKDGMILDLVASAAAIEKEGTVYVAGLVRDVTERNKAQKKLKETKQRYESLFRHNPHSVFYFDLEGNFLDANSQLEKLSGYSHEELLSLNFLPLISDKDKEKSQRRFEKTLTGESQEYEIDGLTKSGKEIPVRITAFPMIVEEEIVGIYGIAEDLTQAKKAKQKLRAKEKKWQILVKNNPQPIQVIDENARILLINKAGADLYGANSPDELMGSSILSFNYPAAQQKIKERVKKMLSGKSVDKYHEHIITNKKGDRRIVQVYSTSVDYQGRKAVQSVYYDITDLRLAERKCKESEERWHQLVENNPECVVITVNNIIKYINIAGAKILGYDDPRQIIGRSQFDFAHPEYRETIEKRDKKLLNKQDLPTSEQKIIDADGKEKNVVVHSVHIKYKGEDAIQSVLQDITDRKRKEQIIENSLQEKEIMLQEIHHRVKNNMAVISGLLELQAMNTQDDTMGQILKESQLRIHSMAMIHEKLYASESFSKIRFNEYVQELSQSIINTTAPDRSKITVRYRLDEVQLNINQAIPCGLILNELIVNCFKHAFVNREQGTILIGLNQQEDQLKMMVEDNGCGLPPDFSIAEQDSLGMKLIQTLTTQVEGELDIEGGTDDMGTCICISLKIE